ncbi:TonB-dependent receptor [Flavobacteriaceae bacterium]|nr:TonB-dependent receptor [Flavobacteriaceae bacterium]
MHTIKKSLFLLLFISFNSFSQDLFDPKTTVNEENSDTVTATNVSLEEVVVSDSRFALKRSQSGKTVVKISSKEIEKFSGLGFGALLSSHLGIDVLGRNLHSGQNPTLSIRGGRNRQVLILIDGVRVSDPSRIDNDFDINSLNLEMMESIEVVKGAASALYGSSAAAGVVNITTKKASESISVFIKKTWGTEQAANEPLNSVNAGNHNISLKGTAAGIGFQASYAERYSDGLSAVKDGTPDAFNLTNLNLGFSGKINEAIKWQLKWNSDEVSSDLDSGYPIEDADYKYGTSLNRYSLNTSYAYENGSLNLNAGFQDNDREYESPFTYGYESDNLNVDLYNKYIFNNKFYTILGLQYQNSEMEAAYDTRVSQSDIYINTVYLDPSGFNFNVGLRYNHHDNYGGNFIYSINPSFNIDLNEKRKLKLLTSYSKAFISPGLYQLFDPVYGNPDLKPEENKSFEFGFEIRSEKNALSLVYFNRSENPTLIFDNTTSKYGNSSKEIVYEGLEMGYEVNVRETMDIRLNYLYTDSTTGDLRMISKHSFNGLMDFPLSQKTNFNIIGQYYGKRIANDMVTDLDAYGLFTLQLNHRLGNQNANLFFSVVNLFDAEYVIIPEYTTRGRNVLAGVSFTID